MYAAHFAAALAIKSRGPRAPTWALLVGCCLPDLVWVVLAVSGIEATASPIFFDDWSHSLASIVGVATMYAACFYTQGPQVWGAIWLAVGSHFPLDALIHPKPLALYPHSAAHIPWDLWTWGAATAPAVATHYWWCELAVLLVLLAVYVGGMRQSALPRRLVAACCVALIGLHLLEI